MYLQKSCLSKDSYLKCINISQSSTLNETNNPVRKSDKIQKDISPKRMYGWQISTWRDFKNYLALGECTLK